MTHYTVEVEVARRGEPTEAEIDAAMDDLAAFGGSFGATPRGWWNARMTFPADSMHQAALTAQRVAENALHGDAIRVEVMTEEEADARDADVPVPDLIGTTEAASILGVSEARVRQMIGEGRLAAHRVGERGIALVRSAIVNEAAHRAA